MSKFGMVVVAAAVLMVACDDKKQAEAPPPNAATESRMETGTAAGAQPSPAVGANVGTTPVDAGAVAPAGSAMMAGNDAGTAASAGAISEADRNEAKTIFSQRCVACHGAAGMGDGAAAAALNPKPRAFGDKAWQASVTDAHIEKIIEQGGSAVGKSPLMPPNPDLVGKPVVRALREYVRNFGSKAAK
ncbi:MAG: c-type cytochrome [Myxococcota bacterium]|nr:c-type cytochrome [Myxococcota bacterium]